MKNGAEQIWSRLRGVFVDELTFSEIKNVAGSAGIPISGLACLVQQDGATKDALMSAVDGLFAKLPTEEQDGFVADFVREAVERKLRIRERIEPLLERLGCSIDEENQLIRTEMPTASKNQQSRTQPMQPVIFISHSSKNLEVGDAILRLLKDAFGLRASELRYTSHPAYGLSGGADPSITLRQEVVAAKLVIGLITTESVESQYVLFELGARWGAEKPLIPLLASGAQSSQLPKPLSAHALTCGNEDSLLRFIKDCGDIIERQADDPSAYMQSLRAVVAASMRAPAIERANNAPLSEVAEEILAAIQSEQDPNSRGVTEIMDSPEFNKSAFFTKLTDSGSPYLIPTQKFRGAMTELLEAGWIQAPEADGNLRVYRYLAKAADNEAAKRDTPNLSKIEETILCILNDWKGDPMGIVKGINTQDIVSALARLNFKISETKLEYILTLLDEKQFVGANYETYGTGTEWFLKRPGLDYLAERDKL